MDTPIFTGANQVSVDAKGRMAMPSKYRQVLQEYCQSQFVVTADRDECLLIYPKPEWLKIESQVMQMPNSNKQVRFLQRILLGYATECVMDSHGRFLLSQMLREFAHINKQAVLLGQGRKFELWDSVSWNRQQSNWIKQDSDTKDVHEALEKILL